MDSTSSPPPVVPAVAEDRTVAIVGYLTLIGFIVAVVLHTNKKTRLGAFHLRQMLGLMVVGLGLMIIGTLLAFVPVGWVVAQLLWIGLFVLWLFGLIAAANGQLKPVPVLGPFFEQWFGRAFE